MQCKINPRSWTRKATKLGYATLLNILWLHHYVSWGPRLSSLRGTTVDPRVCWLVYLVSTVWTECAGKSAACHVCFSLKTIINSRVTQIHNVYISKSYFIIFRFKISLCEDIGNEGVNFLVILILVVWYSLSAWYVNGWKMMLFNNNCISGFTTGCHWWAFTMAHPSVAMTEMVSSVFMATVTRLKRRTCPPTVRMAEQKAQQATCLGAQTPAQESKHIMETDTGYTPSLSGNTIVMMI